MSAGIWIQRVAPCLIQVACVHRTIHTLASQILAQIRLNGYASTTCPHSLKLGARAVAIGMLVLVGGKSASTTIQCIRLKGATKDASRRIPYPTMSAGIWIQRVAPCLIQVACVHRTIHTLASQILAQIRLNGYASTTCPHSLKL